MKRDGVKSVKSEVASNATDVEEEVYLFVTKTCPNCKMAAKFLDDAGIVYDKILAEENPDLTNSFGIKQAPTLVVVDGGKTSKFVGVSDIKKYLDA